MAESNEGIPIKLIVYHSRLFKAHWAILVPFGENDSMTTKIQVTGSLASGFHHEFQRGYVPETTGRTHTIYTLGVVTEDAVKSIVDKPVDVNNTSIATNRLEQVALTILAPGPSLRSAGKTDVRRELVMLSFLRSY